MRSREQFFSGVYFATFLETRVDGVSSNWLRVGGISVNSAIYFFCLIAE